MTKAFSNLTEPLIETPFDRTQPPLGATGAVPFDAEGGGLGATMSELDFGATGSIFLLENIWVN